MRTPVAQEQVFEGQELEISCFSSRGTAVSVWGDEGNGAYPFIPFVPLLSDGRPQFVKPLFQRFSGEHVFKVRPERDMLIIVMEETDTVPSQTGLKVRLAHGKFGKTALQIRRVLRNLVRALRGYHAGEGVRGRG